MDCNCRTMGLGLNTLLEAARYLEAKAEYEARVKANPGFLPSLFFPGLSSEPSFQDNVTITPVKEEVKKNQSPDPLNLVKKSPFKRTQEQREIHCRQVKGQRAELKRHFETLRELLRESDKNYQRRTYTTATVLTKSRKLINTLKEADVSHEMELARLKLEKERLEKDMEQLLMEMNITRAEADVAMNLAFAESPAIGMNTVVGDTEHKDDDVSDVSGTDMIRDNNNNLTIA